MSDSAPLPLLPIALSSRAEQLLSSGQRVLLIGEIGEEREAKLDKLGNILQVLEKHVDQP